MNRRADFSKCNIHCYSCPHLNRINEALSVNVSNIEMAHSYVQLRGIRGLCYLLEYKEDIVSREKLEKHIWDGRVVGESSLPVLMHKIRKILSHTHFKIRSVRGFGYILQEEELRKKIIR